EHRQDAAHDGILGDGYRQPKTSLRAHALTSKEGFRCNVEASHKWSLKERQHCCSTSGLGCPQMKCESGSDDWQHAWSVGKKIWCCEHHKIGCPGSAPAKGAPAPAPRPAPPAPAEVVAVPTPAQRPSPAPAKVI
ncbi:Pip5kl1, partial [Symbiodinium sp. CCMP2456]